MRRLVPILLAPALAGCEIYSVPSALVCPGTRVGAFSFVGTLPVTAPSTSTCSFQSQALNPVSFGGTIAFDSDGGPGACLSRDTPHAALNLGVHSGDALVVGTVDTGGGISGCACPAGTNVAMAIAQTIQGQISRDGGGVPESFSGALITAVSYVNADGTPANLPSCACGTQETDGGCSCNVPCTLQYDLQATAIASP